MIDEVARYYAARAPVYDRTAGYTNPAAEKLREPIKARYRDLLAGRDVLEIACGTGYWTQVIASTARSVLATDVNRDMIDAARRRLGPAPNVTLLVADAYSLEGVPGGFSAAFAHWWWSHVPKAQRRRFLSALHGKLAGGARVLLVDQLPDACTPAKRRWTEAGDVLEERSLPDGRRFEVVKNVPARREMEDLLAGEGTNAQFRVFPGEGSWQLTYEVMK